MIETQMAVKAKQVDELNTQATYLEKTVPDKIDDIKAKKSRVEERFEQLKAPLLERQLQLAKKKEALQVRMLPFLLCVRRRMILLISNFEF